MHARAFGDDLSHLATHLAQETRSALAMLVTWIVGEDATQIAIVNRGPFEVVTLALATIVIAQRSAQRRQRLDLRACSVLRFRACELGHQLIDVFELLQRRPATITTSP